LTRWQIIMAALLLDCLMGDPRYPFHPVRLIGGGAARTETFLRTHVGGGVRAGLIGWIIVVGAACLVGFVLPFLAARALGAAIGADIFQIILIYTTIAPRDMAAHALRVARSLGNPEGSAATRLAAGRSAVSKIVGRDTESLDEAGIVKAAVESVAESTIDGVIAPLFWAMIAGAPGALAYRAINTLDSMWGHKSERYLRFGRVAARADDAANWHPARLGFYAGIIACIPLSLALPGDFHLWSAIRLGWRDRLKHESPNSGWMEALAAGALGIQLSGPAWYGGNRLEKPSLGEARRQPEIADISRAVLLMYATTLVFVAAGCLVP